AGFCLPANMILQAWIVEIRREVRTSHGSVDRPTGIYVENVPDNLLGHVAAQEENGAYHILRLVPSSGCQLLGRPFLVPGAFEDGSAGRRLGDAWSHHVDDDVLL